MTALLVLVTFTLALIADTASVARLVWACLAGQLGTSPQIVVAGLAATVLTACAIAWWPSRRSSGPSARRQAGSTGGRSGGTRATAARKPAERRKQTRTHEAKT
ncbi:hypothetical protein [Rhodopila sp.]|uniref:hypothetical protein n=1 Tax=Rhodopila sp. TaxID=2480087 RepID=UPI002BA7B486|nr:hypothetical protein [Rhodopila sp.]HVZ08959.1 hypothetical protein [Rhodopila sp.]